MKTPLKDKGVQYAAERLGCSVQAVYRLVETRQIAFVDVSTGARASSTAPPTKRHRPVIRFQDEDLDAFIAKRRVAPIETPTSEQTDNAQPALSLVRGSRGRYR